MGLVDLNSTCSLIWHESKATSMDCSDDDQKSLPKMWVPNVSWRHRSGIFFREAAESNVMMSCYAMLIGNRPCNQWPGWSKRTSRWSTETAMRFQSPRVLREPSLLHMLICFSQYPSTESFPKIMEHSMMWKTFTIYGALKSEKNIPCQAAKLLEIHPFPINFASLWHARWSGSRQAWSL